MVTITLYETAKETLMYRTVLWTLWERERVYIQIKQSRTGRLLGDHLVQLFPFSR